MIRRDFRPATTPREFLEGVSKEVMPKPPTNLYEPTKTRLINVAEVYKKQDLPASSTYQPPDYTATRLGAVRTGLIPQPRAVKVILEGGKRRFETVKTGIISQEGLHKRKEEARAKVMAMTTKLKQRVSLASAPIKDKPVPKAKEVVVPKATDVGVSNVGFLAMVDRFFNALNRMLGE